MNADADIIIGYAPPMRGTATRYYLAHVRTRREAVAGLLERV